jgi:flagella basal body P-ring formation protein FlgA
MFVRSVLLATALLISAPLTAMAQSRGVAIAAPVLRANVAVAGAVVRIGDMIDNAGTSAQIAIYRAPDLGTTGSLPTAQVIAALQAHQVIGVDTRNIKAVTVTRLSRAIEAGELRLQVARALEHRNGLGDAANLSLTFDRDVGDLQLDAANAGPLQAVATRYEPRNGRFDVSFEIANDSGAPPAKLRFTGVAIETVEAAVLTRNVERNEVLKSSDVLVERRPKAEVGVDPAGRGQVVGMQMRRPLRAGQALRTSDLAKPDLVQRDDNVTLIYQTAGLYLTIRGKALDNGAEGDTVSVLNLQSKRTISGTVVGRGQLAIAVAAPPLPVAAALPPNGPADPTSLSVAADSGTPVAPKAE